MQIRRAKNFEIKEVKKLVDSIEQMDVIPETFPEKYYRRILKKGILLVAVESKKVIGVCFGTYNIAEKWADLLCLCVRINYRKKGVGNSLIKAFEKIVKEKKLKSIDLFADKTQIQIFKKAGYKRGRTYIAFRKTM